MIYIFGYGSLIDKSSRSRTFPTADAHAARIKGYKRYWSCLDGVEGRTAVVILKEENAYTNGVLVPIEEAFLPELDKREKQYHRIEVQHNEIFTLSDFELPGQTKVYTYICRHASLPDFKRPIIQSYLDVCLRGCLEYGNDFAKEFITETQHWLEHWVDDRAEPMYPRPELMDDHLLGTIDELLSQHISYRRKALRL